MRKKTKTDEKLLTQPIRTRVTAAVHARLKNIQTNSNCRSLGEVACKILSREKILCFYRDVTMNAPMEELASIRKELRSIGININQQTKFFHTSQNEAQWDFYVLRTANLYEKVDDKIDRLLEIVTKMSIKWLQES